MENEKTETSAASPLQKLVIKPCPCGETPDGLCITDAGQGGKWANVAGNCCGEWMIEFRTQYFAQDSDECMKLAREAWNETKRAL